MKRTKKKSAKQVESMRKKERERDLFLSMMFLSRFAHLNIIIHSEAARDFQNKNMEVWLGKGTGKTQNRKQHKKQQQDESILSWQETYVSRIDVSTQYDTLHTPIAGTQAAQDFENYYFYVPVINKLFEVMQKDVGESKPNVVAYIQLALKNIEMIQNQIIKENMGLVGSNVNKIFKLTALQEREREGCEVAGMGGLWQAVYKYNPTMNTAFSTMAVQWIRASIKKHINNLPRIIQIPEAKRELFARVCAAKEKYPSKKAQDIIEIVLNEYVEKIEKNGKKASEQRKRNIRKDIQNFFEINVADINAGASDDNDGVNGNLESRVPDNEPMYTETHAALDMERCQKYAEIIRNTLNNNIQSQIIIWSGGLLDDTPLTDKQIARKLRLPLDEVITLKKVAAEILQNDPTIQTFLENELS